MISKKWKMMHDLSGAGVSPSNFCFMGLVFMGLVLADQSPLSRTNFPLPSRPGSALRH